MDMDRAGEQHRTWTLPSRMHHGMENVVTFLTHMRHAALAICAAYKIGPSGAALGILLLLLSHIFQYIGELALDY
jgi:hypothetical protein